MLSSHRIIAAAIALLLLLPTAAAADHPASFSAPTGPGTPGNGGGVEGAVWEPVATIQTGNTHTDLDFFTQGGETYAAVGTLAAGANDGGQAIIKLTEGGEVTDSPSFVSAFPSASCVTDASGALGLQHDVEATPKGGAILNDTWPNAVTTDAQLLIDATDAPGRCHDQGAAGFASVPQGGLEIIDITDIDNPVEIGLTSHIGEAHTVNVDPSRPHIAYAVTSDAVSVSVDDTDCDGDGDIVELIRENECDGDSDAFDLDGFEMVDLSSCMNFPEGTTAEEKRESCNPEVFRFRFPPLANQLGHTLKGTVYGCHELELYPDDRLTCGSGQALHVFDMAGAFDSNGTPEDRTDDTIRGTALPCERRGTTTALPLPPGLATGAPVIDCVAGADGADLLVPGWLAAGAPSVDGIRHIGSIFHTGRAATGEAAPFGSAEDIDFDHEAELTHSGRFLLASDERGGGVVPPGATCSQGVDNAQGNGGVHAYSIDGLTATTPETAEAAQSAYAQTPDGDRAIYRTSVQTGGEAAFCTAHVFHQIPGQNRIFMAWYTQGTRVVDYVEYPDGTFEFIETGYFIQPSTDQWVSAIFDVADNGDGTFTYHGVSADTLEGRGTIDVYKVTLPAPVQLTDETPDNPAFARVGRDTTNTTAALVGRELAAVPDTVVIGRDDDYADNLTGGVLAASLDAPLLYTATEGLTAVTADEIRRLGVTQAVVLGGPDAVSDDVIGQLSELGVTAERVFGDNRFATAQAVANRIGSSTGTVYVVEGENTDPARGFPDAISISAEAGRQGDSILLVNATRLPDETVAALETLSPERVVIVGGTVAVSQAVEDAINAAGFPTERLAGENRFGTSLATVNAAVAAGASTTRLWLGTGTDWRDALAAAPVAASRGEVLGLIDGSSERDTATEIMNAMGDGLAQARVVGTTDTVTAERLEQLRETFIARTDSEAMALAAARAQTAGVGSTDWLLLVSGLSLVLVAIARRRAQHR